MIAGALAVIAVLFLLYSYNNRKCTSNMAIGSTKQSIAANAYPVAGQSMESPASLLPNDTNQKWGQMNPQGSGQFANISLLDPKQIIGINTVGSTLRNANLQERSEPPNPQNAVGPWNQSTIEPDLLRAPLEIGSCKQ